MSAGVRLLEAEVTCGAHEGVAAQGRAEAVADAPGGASLAGVKRAGAGEGIEGSGKDVLKRAAQGRDSRKELERDSVNLTARRSTPARKRKRRADCQAEHCGAQAPSRDRMKTGGAHQARVRTDFDEVDVRPRGSSRGAGRGEATLLYPAGSRC